MNVNDEKKEQELDKETDTEKTTDANLNQEQSQEPKEKVDAKTDEKQAEKEVKKLQQLVDDLQLKNIKLQLQIEKLNEEYKKQVLEKAKQAEKILNEKIEESKEHYKKEFSEKQKYAIAKDAAKLIDIINNFELALKHSPSDPNIKNYVTGFNMILNLFFNLLEDMSIKRVDIKIGDEFDHNYMEVVEQVSNSKYKTNEVVEILRPAYKLHDRVVSFAKVKVAK